MTPLNNLQPRFRLHQYSMAFLSLTLVLNLGSCGTRSARTVAWPDLDQVPANQTEQPSGDGQNDVAVIVGLEKYQNLPEIPGSVANSFDWQKYLTRNRGVPRSHVTHLMNADAKSFAIKAAVQEASKHVGPGGKFWFVFIGHGAPSQAEEPLLVGYDAELTVAGLEERSVQQRQVLAWMTESAATPVAFFDACFSGSSKEGKSLVPGLQVSVVVESVEASSLSEGVVLTAARSNEFAGALPGAERPAFSYLALAALRGWGDYDKNGEVTGQEVTDYVNETLKRFLHGERSQTPTISGRTSLSLAKALEPEPNIAALVSQYRGEKPTPREAPPQKLLAAEGTEHSIARERQVRVSPLQNVASPSSQTMAPVASQSSVNTGDMVRIPRGTFMMGSDDGADDEKPVHRVIVASFEMDRTEVTVAAYQACVDTGTCEVASAGYLCNAGKADRANHPINCVDWNQARTFCAWAGKRLPTEEEWEYTARGTDGRNFPWGSRPEPSDQLCWNRWTSKEGTCPVGSFPSGASPFGIQDMAGNVREWTSSRYSENYQEARPRYGFVPRGGSWDDSDADLVRSAIRIWDGPSYRDGNLGLRCAR